MRPSQELQRLLDDLELATSVADPAIPDTPHRIF